MHRNVLLLVMLLMAACLSASAKVITPPYEQTFDNASTLDDFTMIDGNGDGDSWDYNAYMHCARSSNWSGEDADEYLVLALQLTKSAAYELTFFCDAGNPGANYDVWLGTAPTKEGLSTCLQPTKLVKQAKSEDVQRISFSVEADGVYYLGFRNCSSPDMATLFLDDLKIEVTAATEPAAATNLVATPAAKGVRECDLQFTLPTTTIAGEPLQGIGGVRIYRNDRLISNYDTNFSTAEYAPGQEVKFHDNYELSNRLYTYKVVAVSTDDKEGEPAVVEAYVGLDSPGRLGNFSCREDLDEPGTVVLSWDAPTVGVHGGYLDPKGIWYVVSKGYENEVEITETTYRDKVNISGGQTYMAYSVYAANAVGTNRTDWQTLSTQVGPAMVAPWAESFAGVAVKNGPWLTHVTGDTSIGEASWYTSSPFDDMPAQDGDGGYTYFFTTMTGKTARYVAPKVDIRQLESPSLTFWLYHWGAKDQVEVGVMPNMTEWHTLSTITLDGTPGWHRYTFDLSAFKDAQFVQVGFNAISVERTQKITAVDNISIRELSPRAMKLENYDFPVRCNVGSEGVFAVTLRNLGEEALKATDYTLRLYCEDGARGNQVVKELEGKALECDQTATFRLAHTPDVFAADVLKYYVEVTLQNGTTPLTYTTPTEEVTVFKPTYPVPTHIQGERSGSNLTLTWTAPDLTVGSALPNEETFEDYEPFSITDCGQWSLYDGDGQFTVTMALQMGSTVTTLQYPHAGEPMAWQVFSSLEAGIPYNSWGPHSGEIMMVAMGNAKAADGSYKQNDDWLISPPLSGRAQQISFFAKCGMGAAYQPELLEVLYSTTDNKPASFKPAMADPIALYNVSDWEEFIVALPEGAKHFALRCVSDHKFALLVDDVTYQPEGTADLELLGYNLYCQQQRLNTSLLTTPTFATALTGVEGEDELAYQVTAVYDLGESLPSAPFTLGGESGISAPMAATTPAATTYDLQGRAYVSQPRAKGIVIMRGKKVVR